MLDVHEPCFIIIQEVNMVLYSYLKVLCSTLINKIIALVLKVVLYRPVKICKINEIDAWQNLCFCLGRTTKYNEILNLIRYDVSIDFFKKNEHQMETRNTLEALSKHYTS
jgi:hypothetical protein